MIYKYVEAMRVDIAQINFKPHSKAEIKPKVLKNSKSADSFGITTYLWKLNFHINLT